MEHTLTYVDTDLLTEVSLVIDGHTVACTTVERGARDSNPSVQRFVRGYFHQPKENDMTTTKKTANTKRASKKATTKKRASKKAPAKKAAARKGTATKATSKKKPAAKKGSTKMDKAILVMERVFVKEKKSRKDCIAALIKEAGLTAGGAPTYYQLIKTRILADES